jgi:alpha-amylase/alpha-mannosidase (GH57 family)
MNLVLWWHMHQPDYRTPEGEFMLPWVYLHALKDYIGMPLNIMSVSGMKANINITPVLIDQWQDYNLKLEQALSEPDHLKAIDLLPDPFLKPLLMTGFDDRWRIWIKKHYTWSNHERMVSRFEPYERLFDLSSHDFNCKYLNDSYYFDLAVWFHLAWCGEWLKKYDGFIIQLIQKESGYTAEDRRLLLRRLTQWLKYGLTLYGQQEVKGASLPSWPPEYPNLIKKEALNNLKSKKKGEYAITLTPYYHPILPLLIDIHSGSVSAQMSGAKYEDIDINEYPEGVRSAKEHIKKLSAYWNREPFAPFKAVWPAEGAISAKTLDLFCEEGVNMCASGEEILGLSMGIDVHKEVSLEGRRIIPLYKVYRWKETPLKLIFRDSELSDLIGFTYSKWRGDDAANDFINRLSLIDDFDKDAYVSIILDGENTWEYYFENGFYFLNDLYNLISSSPKINPLTVKDIAQTEEYISLDDIYPGSWVYGNLQMWIGESQKNTAWLLLASAKNKFLEWAKDVNNGCENVRKVEEQLMKCEGSDWFWWLGPDNPLFSQSQMEKIFREHLKNIYIMMGMDPPLILSSPLISSNLKVAEMGGIMKRGAKT